ncbi:MAG: HAMP domain-containing protein [Chlorobi bacterium]|nr:HAMP domain-containing protein [Chlorobiota bacterium]
MKRPSLRVQLVGVFVLLYSVPFIIFIVWMMDHVQKDFLEEVDGQLEMVAAKIDSLFEKEGKEISKTKDVIHSFATLLDPSHTLFVSVDSETIFRSANFPFNISSIVIPEGSQFATVRKGDVWYRVYQKRSNGLVTHIADNITILEHTIAESRLLLFAYIPLVVIISVVTGFLLVGRILRPLDNIIIKAREISSENLNQRIPNPNTDDEISRLVTTLNEMIERLERSFSRMERFTANASHELRTPLTILKGELAVVLQRERTAEEYREIMKSNYEEVSRIASTVERLFMLAKIDSNLIPVEREIVDLGALVEEVYSEGMTLGKESNITLELDIQDRVVMRGDVILLTQMLLNLVENAVKFNHPSGTVRISLERIDGVARVSVADTGIGIPEHLLNRIFERFYRIKTGSTARNAGAGLGLSIVQWIVDIHGGTIEVSSRPGSGSTFSVFLPVHT